MASILVSGCELPGYLTLIADWKRIETAITETLEEYLITNRFGMAPERINITNPLHRSINHGHKANVKCLYYNFESSVKTSKVVSKEKLLQYDFLNTAGLRVPIVKKKVADILKEYCGEKIQVIDVVITLKSGEEITDYKAINVINRVEAFTWEGSIKGMRYEEYSADFKEYLAKGLSWVPEKTRIQLEKEKRIKFEKYGYPNISTMKEMAFKKEVIDREVICKDSITDEPVIMIGGELATELKKHKFKGVGFFSAYIIHKIV